MKRIDGFTPAMYYAWLVGQAVPEAEANETVAEYTEVYYNTEIPYVEVRTCVDPVTVYPYSSDEVVPF